MTNKLYYGDNLDVLREHIGSGSVDLIYLDPPFNSNANYNILFKSKTGDGSDAQIVKQAQWKNFAELKAQFRSASAVGNRVVFNNAGNKYRLVVIINYGAQIAFVRFVGTHKEYDEVDVKNA